MTERDIKEEMVVNYFKEHPDMFIGEISMILKISKSTIGRYLNKYGKEIIPGKNITIFEQLAINKQRGKRIGGNNSFKNNSFIKDEYGRFTGSIKDEGDIDKEAKKEKDILIITKAFLSNPTLTLEELHFLLNEYSKDYIYDCLTGRKTQELLGEEVSEQISELLRKNHYSFSRKMNGISFDEIDMDSLSEMEEEILQMRNQGVSLEEIARKYGLTHTTIMKIEDKIIKQQQSGFLEQKK